MSRFRLTLWGFAVGMILSHDAKDGTTAVILLSQELLSI